MSGPRWRAMTSWEATWRACSTSCAAPQWGQIRSLTYPQGGRVSGYLQVRVDLLCSSSVFIEGKMVSIYPLLGAFLHSDNDHCEQSRVAGWGMHIARSMYPSLGARTCCDGLPLIQGILSYRSLISRPTNLHEAITRLFVVTAVI